MKRFYLIMSCFLVLAMAFTSLPAKETDGLVKTRAFKTSSQGNTANRTLVNVGAVAMWIYSDGQSSITPAGNSGLIYPRGSSPVTGAIYADGPVWGGIVNDGAEPALRVGGGTYSIGTVPGAIISAGNAEDQNDLQNVDRVWRIRRDFVDANLEQDAAEFNSISLSSVTQAQVDELRAIYRADWEDWPAHKGAPFYDADSNGVYEPQFNADGTPVLYPDADEPGVADADMVVWIVNNDLDPGAVQTLYGSPSIGMEVQTTLWAYARSDALGNIIFKQFRFIYKGTSTTPGNATIDSLHFCQWSDPDLGSFGDDFVGTDTLLSLQYAYNASSNDATYSAAGLPPPAAGYDFFAGPLVEDAEGEAIFNLTKRAGFSNLPMTTAGFFAAGGQDSDPTRGGDYNGTLQWWNLLRGFRPRPESPATPWLDPDGNITKFVLTGDPIAGTGWVDSNPGDRRLLLAAGPFEMALGDTNETVVAAMAGLGSDRLSSVAVLRFTDRFAQEAFDNLFELPKAPPKPIVQATELDGEIFLNWSGDPAGVDATENTVDKGYAFEGYNVYQLPSAGAGLDQGVKLATYDVVNEATVISQEVFDQSSGLILNLPVQLGANSGVTRTFTVTNDAIRDLPLVNGQQYFFGVTAYNYNADNTVKTLESTPTIVPVIPQTTRPGVRFQLASGEQLEVEHTAGVSDGSVTANVVDPASTKDATYEVTFSEDHGSFTWHLTSGGDTLLADQTNQSGDANYLVTDGLQVVVEGPALQGVDWSYEGGRWITGGNHGGELFFGGAFLGLNFWGESQVEAAGYRSIHMDWFAKTGYTDLNGNGQYDIGEPYELDPNDGHQKSHAMQTWGGAYLGFFDVPWNVFDIDADPPRQLACIWRDRDANMQWDLHKLYAEGDPDFVDVNGGDLQFNYIFILDTDYDPTGVDWDASQGGRSFETEILADGGPVQWALWLDQRGSLEPLGDTFNITFIAPKVNTPADVFSFTSMAPSSSDALAKEDALALINAYPNPYLGVNTFEPTRFNRFITFSHLPEQATIRIFNLAGILVRTIEKNDATQFSNWDLQNENGLPVAGGVYIANIEMPELGATKNVKLVIVQEQQFLRRF